MKVKTVVAHANGYGKPFKKRKGSIYSLPDRAATHLIDMGFVCEYERQVRGRKRPRKSPVGIEADNSESVSSESGAESP